MKAPELKSKSEKELRIMLRELEEKLRLLRFDLKAGKIKNVRELHQTRKDIARIFTLLQANQNAK
jgi:large subunit ribosomal protein L29